MVLVVTYRVDVSRVSVGKLEGEMTDILPIDVVPGTDPPVFEWRQVVDTPVGKKVLEHRDALPPTVEQAVAKLVRMARQLLRDNAMIQGTADVLRGTLDMAVDRLGGTVDGQPTHSGNFLQRVDELVANEAADKSERAEGAHAQAARVNQTKRGK